jgi:hypothetical protein
MTEMACPSRVHQQHITDIQERQAVVLKYLASHHASKRDVQNVLYGASMTRRMRVHVALSLDPIFHWQKEKKSNPPRRLSMASIAASEEEYVVKRKFQKHHVDTTTTYENPDGGSLYDLPELMQMGFA